VHLESARAEPGESALLHAEVRHHATDPIPLPSAGIVTRSVTETCAERLSPDISQTPPQTLIASCSAASGGGIRSEDATAHGANLRRCRVAAEGMRFR
jgi:hypothetical protein